MQRVFVETVNEIQSRAEMVSVYSYLDHTTDIRMLTSGETLIELFDACLQGMNEIMKPGICKGTRQFLLFEDIHIQSGDTTLLLVDYLSDILTLNHIHKAVFCDCDIEILSNQELKGVLKGVSVDEFDIDIKAVTYHEADIHLNENGDLETTIILDL